MTDLTYIEAIVLGLVEGVTEYLPISSTGHLILTSAVLGLDSPPQRKHAVDAFSIVIQGGAILAVIGLYWPRIVQMLRGLTGRDPGGWRLLRSIAIAFLPAAILGILLEPWIAKQLFNPPAVVAALALGGVVMIVIGRWQRRFFRDQTDESPEPEDMHEYVDLEHLTWRRALLIGLLQCLAMWPGTSRSMMTIIGGMLVGLKPRQAAEFSFLLALPTLGGACAYKLFTELTSAEPSMFTQLGIGPMTVGFLVATVAAALAVKWLVSYLTKHGLVAFGWYRLALAGLFLVLIGSGWLNISPDEPIVDTPAPISESNSIAAEQ